MQWHPCRSNGDIMDDMTSTMRGQRRMGVVSDCHSSYPMQKGRQSGKKIASSWPCLMSVPARASNAWFLQRRLGVLANQCSQDLFRLLGKGQKGEWKEHENIEHILK